MPSWILSPWAECTTLLFVAPREQNRQHGRLIPYRVSHNDSALNLHRRYAVVADHAGALPAIEQSAIPLGSIA